MAPNERSLENLKKGRRFKKGPQGLDENKSRGQMNRSRNMNILATARTLFESAEILPKLIDNIGEQVDEGQNKDALTLLNIIKEPEKQQIEIDGEAKVVHFKKADLDRALQGIQNLIGGDE